MTNPGIVGPSAGPKLIGADGLVQVADSTQRGGYKWAAPPMPGPTLNMQPVNYRYLRRAIAKVRAGTGIGRAFFIGDSTTGGNLTTDKCYPTYLATMLNSYHVPCAQTWTFPTGVTDPRVTMGTGWTPITLGYFWTIQQVAASTLSLAPSTASCAGPPSVDTFDIYTITLGGGGTATVNVNGGATLATINTNGAGPVVTKTTVTCTAGASNTLNIVYSGGNVGFYLLGINAYLSTSPVLQVANMGLGGATATNWNTIGSVFSYANWVANFAPDLSVIDLGINDAGASVSTATYQATMQSIITRCQAGSGDVMLKSMVPSNGAPHAAIEPTYLTVLNNLAVGNNVALVDNFTRWGSWAASNALSYYVDNLHESQFGAADVAQAVFDAFKAV